MKKTTLVLIITFLTINLFSQELKFSDLSSDKRPQGPFKSYISKDGNVYAAGDKIKIGIPSSKEVFLYIQNGDGVMVAPRQLTAIASNTDSEIKSIVVWGTKRSGFYAIIRSKGLMGALPTTYSIQIENAITAGEIVASGMTSDMALSDLKKAKDKLDLGLITQENYDSIKITLTKFIK